MTSECISFKNTGYFSSFICDYLNEKPELKQLYNRFPKLENFKSQIEEKKQSIQAQSRAVLVSALKEQYKNLDASQATLKNIDALQLENTFTITTGHQLNLFTGPLYFLYKIISTINLTNQLKKAHPEYNFIPVYWMATEDHDFDEINYFNFKGQKIEWNIDASGAVGELSTKGLNAVFEEFSKTLGLGKNANNLKILFKDAYVNHDNLAEATQYLANELFKTYGLVIIDANSKGLKREFVPFMEKELLEQASFKTIKNTNTQIESLGYSIQVNPREINLFYIVKDLRERIIFEDETYKVLNTNITWSKSEIQKMLLEHPERFSPNVILRPLYQEVILPNLCYIGGGGELAYWFQLKENFKANTITFPMLLLRNSVLIQSEKQSEKLKKLNISTSHVFLKQNSLVEKMVKEISSITIDFTKQKKHLKTQFEEFYELAEQTDKSFVGAVSAQEKKQVNGLEHLEKRLLKAQKRKLKDTVDRITELQNRLFPNQSLQERNTNFSELYLEYGEELISKLVEELQPLKGEFLVLTM